MGLPRIASLGDACCGCGACAARCPKGCIAMIPDACGFPRPKVDAFLCVGCGGCDSACPALNPGGTVEPEAVLWARSRDAGERLASSSGGVFGLLARDVLSRGGVVAGAAWGEGCRSARHVLVEREGELDAVMRSKYVQSSVGPEVYRGVRGALLSGRPALFSGTACQVAGMRGYLGRLSDSDMFLGVDVICHGVPSPGLWSKWADHKEAAAGSALRAVNMRSKASGWTSYSAAYAYAAEQDGAAPADSRPFREDWYMRAFLANASLRGSCLACPAKGGRCGSDLTLGDFWGFRSAHPEVADDDLGVSAVLANTARGAEALGRIAGEMESGPSTYEKVLDGNPSLERPAAPHPKREGFLGLLSSGADIPELMRRFPFEPTLAERVRGKLGAVWRRLRDWLRAGKS